MMSEALFLRLLSYDDKSAALVESINEAQEGRSSDSNIHVVDPESFSQIPGSTFAYWVSEHVRHIFTKLPQLEGDDRTAKQGLVTADDFRFLRLWWEVVSKRTITSTIETKSEHLLQQTFSGKCWVPFAKGGVYSPYYSDLHLVVNWGRDGDEIKNFKDIQTGKLFSRPQNTGFYFLPGLTWPLRTQRGLSVRVFPSGCIFSHKGPVIFSKYVSISRLLGLTNSAAFQVFVALQMAFGSYEVGVIQRTPVPDLSGEAGEQLGKLAFICVDIMRDMDSVNETSHIFCLPALLVARGNFLTVRVAEWQEKASEVEQQLAECQCEINELAFHLYGIEGEDQRAIEETLKNARVSQEEREAEDEDNESVTVADTRSLVTDLLSYMIGCTYGRWDIRIATGERNTPELTDHFAPLPACSLGMLTGDDNLPLSETPSEYPLEINWEGILVDDRDHRDDIVRRAQEVLRVIWQDRAEAIEQESCQILEVKELREYFRRLGNGGFWMDHIRRYSKSRRKAPIYWLLQSSKKNYSLWLYYHRLDKDMLFKALTKFVEPKIRLEDSRLEQWHAQLVAAGSEGREARQLERQVERQESLVADLYDFRDKLRRAADLNLEPDLNDGVVLNIAPLRELVPWSEAKKYWDELLAGKYEWSSISKQLRSKGVI